MELRKEKEKLARWWALDRISFSCFAYINLGPGDREIPIGWLSSVNVLEYFATALEPGDFVQLLGLNVVLAAQCYTWTSFDKLLSNQFDFNLRLSICRREKRFEINTRGLCGSCSFNAYWLIRHSTGLAGLSNINAPTPVLVAQVLHFTATCVVLSHRLSPLTSKNMHKFLRIMFGSIKLSSERVLLSLSKHKSKGQPNSTPPPPHHHLLLSFGSSINKSEKFPFN